MASKTRLRKIGGGVWSERPSRPDDALMAREEQFKAGDPVEVFVRAEGYPPGFRWVDAVYVRTTPAGLHSVQLGSKKKRAFAAPYIRRRGGGH